MIRPIMALMVRAQTEDSRRILTYLGRMAFLGIVFFIVIMEEVSSSRSGAPGRKLFEVVTALDLLFLTLGSVSHLAPAIAEEKDEATMSLLRMTRLNPISILFGKGVAKSIELWIIILLQAPLVLLSITLGGVSVAQVIAAFVTMTAYLIFLTGLTLFISTLSNRTSVAVTATIMALLAFHFLPLIIRDMLNYWTWLPAVYLWEMSPFFRIERILSTRFSGSLLSIQTVSNAAMGVVFFLLAWLCFDRFSRNMKEPSPPRLFFSHKGRQSSMKPGQIWRWALMWKDYNFMAGGHPVLWGKSILYSLLVWPIGPTVMRKSINPLKLIQDHDYMDFIPASLSLILLVELLYCVSQVFSEEIRGGTLPTLATLPRSINSIIAEKYAGILIGALPVIILWLPLAMRYMIMSAGGQRLLLTYLGMHVIFLLHVVALLSLEMKRGAVIISIAVLWGGVGLIHVMLEELLPYYFFDSSSGLMQFEMVVEIFAMAILTVLIHRMIPWRVAVAATK